MVSEQPMVNIRLELWGKDDLPVMRQMLGDPAMTTFLGGPQTEEDLIRRQARYEQLVVTGKGRMCKIIDVESGNAIGFMGYWDANHHDEPITEIGWAVFPAFQGKGIARQALALAIEDARSQGKYASLHAFTMRDNAPSNALCQRAGFTLVEISEMDDLKGNLSQFHHWMLVLHPE